LMNSKFSKRTAATASDNSEVSFIELSSSDDSQVVPLGSSLIKDFMRNKKRWMQSQRKLDSDTSTTDISTTDISTTDISFADLADVHARLNLDRDTLNQHLKRSRSTSNMDTDKGVSRSQQRKVVHRLRGESGEMKSKLATDSGQDGAAQSHLQTYGLPDLLESKDFTDKPKRKRVSSESFPKSGSLIEAQERSKATIKEVDWSNLPHLVPNSNSVLALSDVMDTSQGTTNSGYLLDSLTSPGSYSVPFSPSTSSIPSMPSPFNSVLSPFNSAPNPQVPYRLPFFNMYYPPVSFPMPPALLSVSNPTAA